MWIAFDTFVNRSIARLHWKRKAIQCFAHIWIGSGNGIKNLLTNGVSDANHRRSDLRTIIIIISFYSVFFGPPCHVRVPSSQFTHTIRYDGWSASSQTTSAVSSQWTSLIVNCSLDFTLFCIGWCVWIVGFQSKEFNVARLLAIYAAGIVIVVYVRCASHMRMLRNIIFSNPSCDNHECRYKRHDHIQLYVDCVLSCWDVEMLSCANVKCNVSASVYGRVAILWHRFFGFTWLLCTINFLLLWSWCDCMENNCGTSHMLMMEGNNCVRLPKYKKNENQSNLYLIFEPNIAIACEHNLIRQQVNLVPIFGEWQ